MTDITPRLSSSRSWTRYNLVPSVRHTERDPHSLVIYTEQSGPAPFTRSEEGGTLMVMKQPTVSSVGTESFGEALMFTIASIIVRTRIQEFPEEPKGFSRDNDINPVCNLDFLHACPQIQLKLCGSKQQRSLE